MKQIIKQFGCLLLATSLSAIPLASYSAEGELKDQQCLDQLGTQKSRVVGERTGKKVAAAFEDYSNDRVDAALSTLMDMDPSHKFDKAYVDRFIGYLLAAKEGKTKQAMQYLERSLKPGILNHTEQTGAMRLLADLQMQEKQYQQAVDNYRAWMKLSCTESADVYVRIAQALYELNKLEELLAPADRAIHLYNKPNQNPYILKLSSYYDRKKYPEAIGVLESLVRLFAEEKRWWTQLGSFYMINEQYKKALQTMELAHKQGYLKKASEIKTLAQLYATNNVPYKAAKLLEEYIGNGLLERTASNLSLLANVYHSAKEIEKSANYYGEAAKLSNDPTYYRRQGVLLLEMKSYPAAIQALNKALELGIKDQGSVYMSLTEAYFYQEKFKDAYAQVQKAKEFPKVAKTAASWESYIKVKAKNNRVSL